MDGIFGWLGDHGAHQDLIKHMGRAAKLSPEGLLHEHSSQILGVAACSRFGKADIHVENGLAAALYGRPHFLDDELACIARDQSPAMAVAYGWVRLGEKLPMLMRGNFAFAVLEPLKKRACLVLDRVGSERLCYAKHNGQLIFGSSVQSVAAHPAVGRVIDPQAIYDYLYFHTIPAPRSLYQGVHKLLPGQIVTLKDGQISADFYWQADYTSVATDFDSRRHGQLNDCRRAHCRTRRPGRHLFHRLRRRGIRRNGIRALRRRTLWQPSPRVLPEACGHRDRDSCHCE